MTPNEKQAFVKEVQLYIDDVNSVRCAAPAISPTDLDEFSAAWKAFSALGGPGAFRMIFIGMLDAPECFWSVHARNISVSKRVDMAKTLRTMADIFDPSRIAGDA